VVLNKDVLLTTDPDTSADELVYTVLSGPSNGKLVHRTDMESKVETFTQQQINNGDLLFLQNGTQGNGNMYFKVTDGQFPALYKMLVISVIPVVINVSQIKPVDLVQSESSVHLSSKFLNVTTNGGWEDLKYEVTVAPKYGHIAKGGKEVRHFSQSDVVLKTVLYVMHSFSQSEDWFRCDIRMENLDVHVKDQTVRIIVRPLVKQLPLVVPAGATVSITQNVLDASELAQRTGDDPTFEITAQPSHGTILRKLRKRREVTAQPVMRPVHSFTFEDVVYAKIVYVSNVSESSDNPPPPDSFSYILRANKAQPAMGKFYINMDKSEMDDDDENRTDNADSDAEVSRSQSDDDENNDMVIVGAVLGVLLVLAVIVAVVVVVVVWKRRQDNERHKESLEQRNKPRPFISGPLQLEQHPHVTIEPHGLSPGEGENNEERCLMRHSAYQAGLPVINISHDGSPHHHPDHSRSEVSFAVPDCKVTPLVDNRDSVTESVGDRRQSGRSSTGTDLYDWTLMDPELLEHCRTETPVLRDKQYWV
jgi:hypothetical protein